VAGVSRALAERADISSVRDLFERQLCRMLGVRSVQLKDARNRWSSSGNSAKTTESVTFEVPGSNGALLEACFGAGSPLGDWDYQALGTAAHLAALICEIDRVRQQLVRAGLAPPAKPVRDNATPLVGRTPAMQALRAQIERVAATDFTVLLEGESGVGKELVARQIHELSRRSSGPFVAVNCAALVETLVEAELFGIEERTATGVRGRRGKFEHAEGGTLFLDEVSDLSIASQAKLLRAIQELAVERVGGHGAHRVDVRIVAATNRPLRPLVERRLFRPDLFFRLSGVDVNVPSLRDRRADVLELARYFLDRHRSTRRLRLSAAAADALVAYDWPGNVRELERLMERAITLADSDAVELDDLPLNVRGDVGPMVSALKGDETMRAWGSRYARLVLDRTGGNKRDACRVLGISYHTLNAYLRYPIQAESAASNAGWVAEPSVPSSSDVQAVEG
jgi:transcriptional regulator with PAS, ATPase and Fis domain